ncbi:DNA adenine methylase [Candidatus Woesearchaeota archaeon]|nr:DNA adenine methylase [Candidatus Woesearchaeota archaeon]
MGSKRIHLPIINKCIKWIFDNKDSSKYDYVEPFLGSGIVFLNLEANFKKYIINDYQQELVLFFKNYSLISRDKLLSLSDKEKNKFNIEKSKEGYYKFRDLFNKGELNELKKTIAFIFLANTCINNLVRFGPNGFNQSYGVRKYSNKFDTILSSIDFCKKRKPVVFNDDFKKILKKVDKKSFLFLDPPYYTLKDRYGWKKENTTFLCDWLIENENISFIYTDILNENKSFNKLIKRYKYKKLNSNLHNSAPKRRAKPKDGKERIEVMIYNKGKS